MHLHVPMRAITSFFINKLSKNQAYNFNQFKFLKLIIYIFILTQMVPLGISENSYHDFFGENEWEDCGGSIWNLDYATNHNNSSSLRSGPIENSGTSKICLKLRGPSMVSFWWKSNINHNGIGQLSFLVNGSRRYLCDSNDWKFESYSIRQDGNCTLTWELIKFKSYPKNAGAGWISDVRIEPRNNGFLAKSSG